MKVELSVKADCINGSIYESFVSLKVGEAVAVFKISPCRCGNSVYATEMIAGEEGLKSIPLRKGFLTTIQKAEINESVS